MYSRYKFKASPAPLRQRCHIPSFRECFGAASLIPVFLVTFSIIEKAEWVRDLPPLSIICFLSLLTSIFLVRGYISWKVAVPLTAFLGFALSLGAGLLFLGDSPLMSMAIVLMTVTWTCVYATIWIAFRRTSSILMFVPTLLVVLVALAFLPIEFYTRLLYYLLVAAPAMAYFHYWHHAQAFKWNSAIACLFTGLAIMSLIAVPIWQLPNLDVSFRPAVFKRLEEPLYVIQSGLFSIFRNIPNRRDLPHFHLESVLPFTGPIYPTDDIVMVVKSDKPYKWRLRVYETYTKAGWVNSPDLAMVKVDANAFITTPSVNHNIMREQVEILVRPSARMEHMVFAGTPQIIGRGGLVEQSPIPIFKIDLTDIQKDYLPKNVVAIRDQLALTGDWYQSDYVGLMLELDRLGFTILAADAALESGTLQLERKAASPALALGVIFKEILAPAPRHSTVGSISIASPDMLRSDSQTYPSWILDRYLQLPIEFPVRVRLLAEKLASSGDNSYDKAKSVQEYLTSIPFDSNIVAPMTGQDAVEYFLFVKGVGYCQYYASAMITMLRHLGIPARLVVGFSPGEWDNYRGAWVIQGKHFHAWPEVFFADYGWVEFEPTPASVQPGLRPLGFSRDRVTPETQVGAAENECLALMGAPCQDSTEMMETDIDPVMDVDGTDGIVSHERWGVFFRMEVVTGVILVFGLVGILASILYLRTVSRVSSYPWVIYNMMCLLGRLGGQRRRAQDTPLEYANRLTLHLPYRGYAVDYIVRSYVSTKYGRNKEVSPEQHKHLRDSWKMLRWPLLKLAIARFLHVSFWRRQRFGYRIH